MILDGPEEIRGKLESLRGEKRVDSSAIKGLEKAEKIIGMLERG